MSGSGTVYIPPNMSWQAMNFGIASTVFAVYMLREPRARIAALAYSVVAKSCATGLPRYKATASAPCRSMIAVSRSSMTANASSQDAGRSPVTGPRTQAERTRVTIEQIVSVARRAFADDGFDATSVDGIVERAGMTKGALYHHFAGKRALFAAVYEAEQHAIGQAVLRAARGGDSSWQNFLAGSTAGVAEMGCAYTVAALSSTLCWIRACSASR